MKAGSAFSIIAALLVAAGARAASVDGDAGSRGYKFLQLIPDARTVATGSVAAVSGAGAGAIATNPALLTDAGGFRAALSHAEWLGAIRHEYLAFSWPGFGGTVGLGFRAQSSGDIPLRTDDLGPGGLVGEPAPEPSGTYGVHDGALTIAYARRHGRIDWGVATGLVWEKIYTASATAVAVDLGARWRGGEIAGGSWHAGAVVHNAGVSGTLREERIPLPWDARAGVGWDRTFGVADVRLMADARYAPDWFETANLGAEAVLARTLAIRAGWRTGITGTLGGSAFSAGLGLRRGSIGVDWAYIPKDDGLGDRHLFGVVIGR